MKVILVVLNFRPSCVVGGNTLTLICSHNECDRNLMLSRYELTFADKLLLLLIIADIINKNKRIDR